MCLSSSSFFASRIWRIFRPSFTTMKMPSPRAFRHQTGSPAAHSWLVERNSLRSLPPSPATDHPPSTPGPSGFPLPPKRGPAEWPHKPTRLPTAAAVVGGAVRGRRRGAMMMRMRGTTCERWRSIAPMIRAIVGITRAPPMRRPRPAPVTRATIAAKSSSSHACTARSCCCSC